jgi:hypothetical protein
LYFYAYAAFFIHILTMRVPGLVQVRQLVPGPGFDVERPEAGHGGVEELAAGHEDGVVADVRASQVLQVEHLLACRVVGPRAARNVEEIDRDELLGVNVMITILGDFDQLIVLHICTN